MGKMVSIDIHQIFTRCPRVYPKKALVFFSSKNKTAFPLSNRSSIFHWWFLSHFYPNKITASCLAASFLWSSIRFPLKTIHFGVALMDTPTLPYYYPILWTIICHHSLLSTFLGYHFWKPPSWRFPGNVHSMDGLFHGKSQNKMDNN